MEASITATPSGRGLEKSIYYREREGGTEEEGEKEEERGERR
jgi:hypothetical protein